VRVGVDGRSLADAGNRGVATYLRELLFALSAAFPADELAVLVPGRRPDAPEALRTAPNVRVVRTRLPGRALHTAGAALGSPSVDRLVGPCDVVWAPAVAPLALPRAAPLVLTVHDLSFEHRPRDFSFYERLWHRAARPRRLAARAARVIAVSEATRSELLAEWALEPERTVAVRSGPGRPAGAEAAPPAGLPSTFVLGVGALEPRKRPDLLVEAHRRARRRGLEAGLVLAGDGSMRGRLAGDGVTELGRVSDAELDGLYRGAMVLALASREEGFGFTPLEALARGTPVVAVDLPAIRETAGAGALPVVGGDADALAEALLRFEREPELRRTLLAGATDALDGLSWDRSARETRATLAAACGA